MRRAIIIALLALAGVSGENSEAAYWQSVDRDFRIASNTFADEYNRLMKGYLDGKWNVKDARRVAGLFDKVYNHPLYRK